MSLISSPLLLLFYSAFSGTGALTEVTFASYMTGGVRKWTNVYVLFLWQKNRLELWGVANFFIPHGLSVTWLQSTTLSYVYVIWNMGTFIFSSPLPLAIPVAIFVLFIVSIVIDFMTLLQKLHTHENKSKNNILHVDLRSENKCYFMR